ncbi:beta-glucanase (GH16 family) [Haloferula luteola]|uniref:Beta-glucanase (GH16 family) n=1 Tax=Haloferula luteola TaxID=595692 RepID=A0A840V983_9BACT|nr:glycoside hydrolase family 16 protein [Haloferula luteola]MBB5351268.1 beta-glucanase (GH16 family) [Haloferula luteola]
MRILAGWVAVGLAAGAETPWKLVWSDEFDGEQLDPEKWDYQIGNGYYAYDAQQWIAGWGNQELQYYTEEKRNVAVSDGELVIRALKESLHGCGYTSGRLRSVRRDGKTLFSQKYGRFEFRAKLPTGQGIWPALWMLPDQGNPYGPWAASGEIDIMEARGQEPGRILGTIHYGSRWPGNVHSGGEFEFPEGEGIDGWHVYALEWEPGELRWYVDGENYSTKRFWWSSSKTLEGNVGQGAVPQSESDLNPWPAPFDQPFHLVMNLAVGGQFLGNPDVSTAFPVEMRVDYVRVYEGPEKPVAPRGTGKLPFGG